MQDIQIDTNHPKILLIEDDLEIARLTCMFLNAEGYRLTHIDNGLDALKAIEEIQPDILLLDLMLPGLNGIEICQQARTRYWGPILVLTACDDEMSEVSLLKLGADDYLTKPVKPQILLARIQALLRRSQSEKLPKNPCDAVLTLGNIQINPSKQRVYYQGEAIQLTTAEYDLLLVLADNVGEALSREACCKALRGIDYDVTDRSIDMRISGLRRKLKDDMPPYRLILTIRNKGYKLIHE